jgi:hypothetical protein
MAPKLVTVPGKEVATSSAKHRLRSIQASGMRRLSAESGVRITHDLAHQRHVEAMDA